MRKSVCVISSSWEGRKSKKCTDFTMLNIVLHNRGTILVRGCIYDTRLMSYQISTALSKLPIIRDKEDFTWVQNIFGVMKSCIPHADEIICGFYRRDIGMLNQVYRSFKGTSINPDSLIYPLKQNVREMFYGIPSIGNGKVSHRELADFYDVNIEDAQDIACEVFGEAYWEDLPASAVKAALYLCARLSELGYASSTVADAIIEHMERYYENGDIFVPVVMERSVG